MDEPTGVGLIVRTVFQENENLRHENAALRKLLRDRGVKKRDIQKAVAAYLKPLGVRGSLNRRWTTMIQSVEAILSEIDLRKQLAKLPVQGKPQ